mmetsp:Transcript_33727/g.54373  ORF Transcript_33727/g.54373 Transcript_33727/m.54373 type:complete len:91 (-) Transcript_33727:126-398(-)
MTCEHKKVIILRGSAGTPRFRNTRANVFACVMASRTRSIGATHAFFFCIVFANGFCPASQFFLVSLDAFVADRVSHPKRHVARGVQTERN